MSALPKFEVSHPNLDQLYALRARVRSRRIRAFLDYMIGLHPADALPARRDFQPMAIPTLLSGVSLAVVERSGDRIRFLNRVVGQSIVETAAPVKIANRYLDDVAADIGGDAGRIIVSRMTVLLTGLSYLCQSRPVAPLAHKAREAEYVHCPLASDGVTVDQIVSCFCYDPEA